MSFRAPKIIHLPLQSQLMGWEYISIVPVGDYAVAKRNVSDDSVHKVICYKGHSRESKPPQPVDTGAVIRVRVVSVSKRSRLNNYDCLRQC